MFIHGRTRWIYPRKGRLVVRYKRKERPIYFRRGRPRVLYRKKWRGFRQRKIPAKIRLRYGGKWRYVTRYRRSWTIKYLGRRRKITLRGSRFGIRIGRRWRYVPARGGTLQIRHGRKWRRVRNCCNKLRAVLRGRLRRVQFRYGKAKMRGRKGWTPIYRGKNRNFKFRRIRGICDICDMSWYDFRHYPSTSWVKPQAIILKAGLHATIYLPDLSARKVCVLGWNRACPFKWYPTSIPSCGGVSFSMFLKMLFGQVLLLTWAVWDWQGSAVQAL